MRQSDILLFFDRAFAHGSDGSQLYICFEKIYNGTDLQLMHMAADDDHAAHLLLSFMWFFCPSARAAARRLIESSHDMIRPNIVLYRLTLT